VADQAPLPMNIGGNDPFVQSIFDFSDGALQGLRNYLEQNPPATLLENVLGFSQFTAKAVTAAGISGSNAPGVGASAAGPEIDGLDTGTYLVIATCDMQSGFGAPTTFTLSPVSLTVYGGGAQVHSLSKATVWKTTTQGQNITSTVAVGANGGSSDEAYVVGPATIIALKFANL